MPLSVSGFAAYGSTWSNSEQFWSLRLNVNATQASSATQRALQSSSVDCWAIKYPKPGKAWLR
jgi:hypothetical protein